MPSEQDNQELGKAFVVSQDRDTWRISRNVLRAQDYVPEHLPHTDGIDKLAARLKPSIILLDESALDTDSPTACRSIRELPDCEDIPLLLIAEEDRNFDDVYAVDVTSVVTRPLDDTEFASTIRALVDTERTLSGIRALRPTGGTMLEAVPDAFFVVGKDGEIRQYLGGASDDFVLSPTSLQGNNVKDTWPADKSRQFIDGVRRAIRTRDGHSMKLELERDGDQRVYEVRLLVQGRDRVLAIFRDISTAPIQGASSSRDSDGQAALIDDDAFLSTLEEAVADACMRERGLAVMCLDIDRFEQINESLGETVGNTVLKVSAQRIERCLRTYDRLARVEDHDDSSLTRLGNHEFVLMLGNIESRDDISTVAQRIHEAFDEPIAIDDHKLNVTPSIGIAQFPLDGADSASLLKNARVALDEASTTSAQGHEFYSNTMRFRALNRFDVKDELRWAIDNEQLEIHYLPRIDLRTGHVAGLEALLRWMHPLRGSVPLAEVIPLAEATGLIFAIGEWVIRSACKQAQAWYEEYGDVPPVSVNLSQQEFTRDDLPRLVSNALQLTGLPPGKLELELTEAMLMRNRHADATIRELDKLGVGIVLDDFGQGHSSVVHLTELPIKALKIDRAFVEHTREPGKQQAICAAVIAMSRELGISVIAEGVESELQVAFLKERGCDAVQGFLFTEPLPADSVPGFLSACAEIASETQIIDLTTVRHKIASRALS